MPAPAQGEGGPVGRAPCVPTLEGGWRLGRRDPGFTPGDPVISVVTVALNAAETIEKALKSIDDQGYPNVELIVLDGGSNDGTTEILHKFDDRIAYWRSAPDDGPIVAANDGFRMTTGEIVGFLNADDWYEKDVFRPVVDIFASDTEIGVVSGGARMVTELPDGRLQTVESYSRPKDVDLSWPVVTLGVPIISARFFRRNLLEKVGPFDPRFSFANDREFLIRVLLSGVKTRRLDKVVYTYLSHEKSFSLDPSEKRRLEFRQLHLRLCETYLAKDDLPPDPTKRLRKWHAQEAAHLAILHIQRGAFVAAMEAVWRGWRRNVFWPLEFFSRVTLLVAWKCRSMSRRRGVNVV